MSWRPFLAGFSVAVAVVAAVAFARTDQAVLYEKRSSYNTIVVTDEGNGVRALRFGEYGVRQSAVKIGDPGHLVLPYVPVALVGLALSAETRRFLVVGLGGGTLPMFLRKYYPEAAIDVVDIDPGVVNVAKRFFGFREDQRMKAHVADGRRFIEETQQTYDVIFLDAFGSNSIPAHLTTREFLQAVRRAAAPGGVVVGNVWGRDELIQLARKASAARQFPFDLGKPVTYGFVGMCPPRANAVACCATGISRNAKGVPDHAEQAAVLPLCAFAGIRRGGGK